MANGNTASIVGLNRILVSKQFQDQPFLYEGAISIVFNNKNTLVKIDSIINKITKNWKMNYKIILTGGYANLFKKIIKRKCIVDQDITIKGASRVYREFL